MAIRIREKDVPATVIWVVFVIIVLMSVLLIPLNAKEKENVEMPYSHDMSIGDKAYVDITYCEPRYVITDSRHPARGVQYIVCEAQTINDGTMLIAISGYYYRSDYFEGSMVVDSLKYYEDGKYIPSGSYPTLSFDVPYRLHCRVSDVKEYGLDSKESGSVVLELNYNNEG